MTAAPATVMHSRQIPLAQLREHPHNVRDNDGDMLELVESIRQVGLLQPIVVCPDQRSFARETVYVVLAGHRRLKAVRQLGWASAPCIVRPPTRDLNEARVIMLIENLQRTNLSAAEKARAFGAMRASGLTYPQIAARCGIAESTVGYFLRLLDLDDATLDRVERGELAVEAAQSAVLAARKAGRKASGARPPGRAVVVHNAHFTKKHPLAGTVRDMCDHHDRPKIDRLGCGQCWEAAIRADEREWLDVTVPEVDADGPVRVLAPSVMSAQERLL